MRFEGRAPGPPLRLPGRRAARRLSPRSARSRSGRTRCPPRSTPRSTASRRSRPCASSSRFHRVQGSPGFAAAAEHMRKKAAAAGLSDARDRALPRRRQDEVRALPALLRLDSGLRRARGGLADAGTAIAAFPELPVALADYSQDADVTAPLVDVGAGTTSGRLRGPGRARQARARGRRPSHGASPRLPRAGRRGLSLRLSRTRRRRGPATTATSSAGATSRPTSSGTASRSWSRSGRPRHFRARLAAGENDRALRRAVDAKMVPATYDVVVATIPGTDPASGEVVLTAHLCHQSAGANDNASGSAAHPRGRPRARGGDPAGDAAAAEADDPVPLAAGDRGLAGLARPPPRARLAASWPASTWTWSAGLLSTTKGTLPPLAHGGVAAPRRQSDRRGLVRPGPGRFAALRGGRGGDAYAGFVWPPGSREPFLARHARDRDGQRPRGLRGGGLPRSRWSTSTTSPTSRSTRRRTCPRTSTRRSSAASRTWAPESPGHSRRCPTPRRRPCSPSRAPRSSSASWRAAPRPGPTRPSRRAKRSLQGVETLESLGRLSPSIAPDVAADVEHLRAAMPPPPPTSDRRVPVRAATIVGPLNVYYYDYFAEASAPTRHRRTDFTARAPWPVAKTAKSSPTRPSISPTGSGRSPRSATRCPAATRPSPLSAVAEYFELLARAGAVSFR